jgi:inner membrane protein
MDNGYGFSRTLGFREKPAAGAGVESGRFSVRPSRDLYAFDNDRPERRRRHRLLIMYRTGHYGAGLLAYAPLCALLLATGRPILAGAGAVLSLGLSMVPDWDHWLPLLSHRGFTHTVWFALLVGLLLGAAGWSLGSHLETATRSILAAFGLVLGVLAILAHVLADALTPMGVRPFAPLCEDTVSLRVMRAGSPVGNGLLLVLGVLAAGGAIVAGRELAVPLL